MDSKNKQTLNLLQDLIEFENIEDLSTDQILSSFAEDKLLKSKSEIIKTLVDPRNNEPVIYNPSRNTRPRDYQDPSSDSIPIRKECPICKGGTTGILDWKELNDGCTFINKNLFPVLSIPNKTIEIDHSKRPQALGLHFLQWTSSAHDNDWHNMAQEDCNKVMRRLAVLEKSLIRVGKEISKRNEFSGISHGNNWNVSIIKNVGAAVGGSLEHGHQQIILGNIAPQRILNNKKFLEQRGQTFSESIQSANPPELLIKDYGSAVLMVAEFMRRPFDMMLLLKDTHKSYLHELNKDELNAISRGWKEACQIFNVVQPSLSREVAYNIVTHNGPGAGLYFEFFPFTQEEGGLEHLGLPVCQADPHKIAKQIRNILN